MGFLKVRHGLQIDLVRTFLALHVLGVVLDLVALLILVSCAVVVQHTHVEVSVEELRIELDALFVGPFRFFVPFQHFSLGRRIAFLGIRLAVVKAALHRIKYGVLRIFFDRQFHHFLCFFRTIGGEQVAHQIEDQVLVVGELLHAFACGGDRSVEVPTTPLKPRDVPVDLRFVVPQLDRFPVALDRHGGIAF